MDRLAGWMGHVNRATPRPEQVAARRLGAALRLVLDRIVTTEAPADDLAAAADEVEALAARLLAFPHGGLYRGRERPRGENGLPAIFFDYGPLLGRSNPLAPPLTIEVAATGDAVIGRATFGHAYEGPPGCVHGGFIAACFDDLLGLVQSVQEQIAMTGTLTVRYLAPTPLHTEVRFVGRLDGIDGRKVVTRGELWAGETCTAQATGVFITVGTDRFDQLRTASRHES